MCVFGILRKQVNWTIVAMIKKQSKEVKPCLITKDY